MADVTHAPHREQLAEERRHLVEQLAELGYGPEGKLDYDEGFADTGQVTAERGEAEALAGALTEQLTDVDDALTKLEDGRYGRCEGCGGAIPEARLEALPAARLCITCASAGS
ncbi:MAG: TraR/DksA family transcriptional regulator [Acidimicrobiia bacterium]